MRIDMKMMVDVVVFLPLVVWFPGCATRSLYEAVRSGNIKEVRRHIEIGADVNARDKDDNSGYTPLFWAIDGNCTEIVKLLIIAGADVNAKTRSMVVHESGIIRTTSSYRGVQGDINTSAHVLRTENGWTLLHWAAYQSHTEIAKQLIATGADVNARDKDARTPLDVAVHWNSNSNIVKLLILKSTTDKNGYTPLHRAAYRGYTDIVKQLIATGADVNVRDKDARTPLHVAAYWGYTDIVKQLIATGADVNARDKDGRTPLDHLTAFRGRTDIAELLRRHGLKNESSESERANNPEIWVESGRARLFAKNLRGAETAFRQALRLDDKYLPAYKHLGLVLVELKRYQEAKNIYEQALRISDKDSELWTVYGYCLIDLGRDKQALEVFQQSITLNTDPVSVISARLGVSALLRRQGDETGAKREYEKAVRINPEIVRMLSEQRALTDREIVDQSQETVP